MTAWGGLHLLEGALLGFFCSVRAPGDALLKIYDLARALRGRSVTLVGGFQSPMEKEFLDRMLVAHAAPGGETERLCLDALAAGKRVFTLASSDNAHLMARGAVSVAADDPSACLGDGVGGPA